MVGDRVYSILLIGKGLMYLLKIGKDWELPRPYMYRHPCAVVVAKFSTSAYGNYAALSAWGNHLFYHERQACRG